MKTRQAIRVNGIERLVIKYINKNKQVYKKNYKIKKKCI